MRNNTINNLTNKLKNTHNNSKKIVRSKSYDSFFKKKNEKKKPSKKIKNVLMLIALFSIGILSYHFIKKKLNNLSFIYE